MNSLMNVHTIAAGLAAGAEVVVPHTLHDGNGNRMVPNFIYPFATGTQVRPRLYSATTVTYHNYGTGSLPNDVKFRVAYDHTIPRGTTTAASQFIYAGPASDANGVGPTGPSGGPTGPTGPTGPSDGPTGATGAEGPTGPGAGATGPAGPAMDASMFYGTTAGTGTEGNDYAATVAAGAAVPFPRNGPTTGVILRSGVSTTQIAIPATGIYEVSWQVEFLEASQLQVWGGAGGVTVLANTTTYSGAGTQQNSNTVLISATIGDLISICNPAGNPEALTVQTAGTLTHAQAPSLVVKRIS